MTDALGNPTNFSLDANGNLLSLSDARGGVTSYVYNSMDRVTSRTDPLLRAESYAYDAAGNLTRLTDRRGVITELSRRNGGGQQDGAVRSGPPPLAKRK